MTEAELMEHAQMAYGNAIAAFALMFTILSAYLAVAYFIGKNLSRSQVTTINMLFFLSVTITIFAGHGFFSAAVVSTLEVFEINPSRATVPLHPSMPIGVTAIDLVIVAACLKFMWDIRHSNDD